MHDHIIWWFILVIWIIVWIIIIVNFIKWLFSNKKRKKKKSKKDKKNSILGDKDISKKYKIPLNDYYRKYPEKHARDEKLWAFMQKISNPFKYIYFKAIKIRKKDELLITNKEKLILLIDNYRHKNPIKLFKYIVLLLTVILLIQPYFNFDKEVIIQSDREIIIVDSENLYSLNKKLNIHEIPLIRLKEGECISVRYQQLGFCKFMAYSTYSIRIYSLYYKIYVFSNHDDVKIQAWIYHLKWNSNIDEIIQQIEKQSKKIVQ